MRDTVSTVNPDAPAQSPPLYCPVLSGPGKISCCQHEEDASSREGCAEKKDRPFLRSKEEETENDPRDREERQPADRTRDPERPGGLGGMVAQGNHRCIDSDEGDKEREIGHICDERDVTGEYQDD